MRKGKHAKVDDERLKKIAKKSVNSRIINRVKNNIVK